MTIVNSPIFIDGNAQLASQASFGGNGSSESPYIIADYMISNCASFVDGVRIQNTNKYFILMNINVSHCDDGFYFSNVTFGRIINSFASFNNFEGFNLYSSSNNILIINMATNNSGDGFSLASSSNNFLTSCTAINNTLDGFSLSHSS